MHAPEIHVPLRRSVLIVEDDRDTREALRDALTDMGIEVQAEASAEAGLQELHSRDYATVLTDVRMAGMGGIALCRRVREDGPRVPVVVMTAFGDVPLVAAALRAGAFDFVTKPFTLEQVSSVLERAFHHHSTTSSARLLGRHPAATSVAQSLNGASPAIERARHAVVSAANSDLTTLITGESGTGKELAARAIHEGSSRAKGPFVAVSCAALPAEVLAGELCGHTRGAFTGAEQPMPGLFVEAQGGTLFLDEIGEMPLELQPHLLRVLQERKVRPLGSHKEVPFDVRIVAATNRDLEEEVRANRFREALFYRLNVLRVHLPPLRERGDDVISLARHFLGAQQSNGSTRRFTPDAEAMLLSYDWPGNVRELEHYVQAVSLLTREGDIGAADMKTLRWQSHVGATVGTPTLEEIERRHISLALQVYGGNKALAAKKLGIDRATLYRKMRRMGLETV